MCIFPEIGDFVYIPSRQFYSGGLAEVKGILNGKIRTKFGFFDWKRLSCIQEELQHIFETEKAAFWK